MGEKESVMGRIYGTCKSLAWSKAVKERLVDLTNAVWMWRHVY